MTTQQVRQRYNKIHIDREPSARWVKRLATWKDFYNESKQSHELLSVYLRTGKKHTLLDAIDLKSVRRHCPELFDLLFEMYGGLTEVHSLLKLAEDEKDGYF